MKHTITNIIEAQENGLKTRKETFFDEGHLQNALHDVKQNEQDIIIYFTLNVGDYDPLHLLSEGLDSTICPEFYWDQPNSQKSFIAGKPEFEVIPQSTHHFSELSTKYRSCKTFDISTDGEAEHGSIPCWIGGLQFDANNAQNPSYHKSRFIIPKWIYLNDKGTTWLRIYYKLEPSDTFGQVTQQLKNNLNEQIRLLNSISFDKSLSKTSSKDDPIDVSVINQNDEKTYWKRAVEQIKQQIAAREIQKLVLARQLHVKIHGKRAKVEIMDYLRREYPECTNLLVRVDDESYFISSTPEHILTINNRQFYTESLAGSSSRGSEVVADQKNRYDLLSSSKNLHEHRIVRDDILCQLENYIKDITFPKSPEVKQLTNVQHLFTPIEGTIINGADAFNILAQLHPTPAVGGYPRYNINSMIKDLEGFERGWYASPVGWLDENGDAEFVVAIRCGYISPDHALLYAGCGVVRASDPIEEWEETKLKFRPLLHAIRQQ